MQETQQKSDLILVIDDDAYVRESVTACLEDAGHEVIEAENGQTGLSAFREKSPGLVLCDLRMPDIDGLEVLAAITKESPDTPIIMISGAGIIQDVVKALRLGAWDYLVKPISDLTVLEHTIDNALKRSHLERENKHYREELEMTNRELEQNLAILQEDQEAGRQAQMQMLPDAMTKFTDYSFEQVVIPSLYLSGDFLDYFEISERYLGFYIIDVSGHGASSAFVTMMLKSFMNHPMRAYRNEQDETILQPDKLLQYLNQEILHANLGKYLTMFYGVIDREMNHLHYAIGGHYPRPLLLADDKAPIMLPGSGFPVGLFDWATYQAETIVIPDRFMLGLFSDGLLEILTEETAEDRESILLELCTSHDMTVEDIVKRLGLDKLKMAPDDITLFFVKRCLN